MIFGNNVIDTVTIDYKSYGDYVTYNDVTAEENANTKFEYLVACHYENDSEIYVQDGVLSNYNFRVYAIFNKRLSKYSEEDERKKLLLYIPPLLPLDGSLILANILSRSFENVSPNYKLIVRDDASTSKKEDYKFYRFKLQEKNKLYYEKIKNIIISTFAISIRISEHIKEELNFLKLERFSIQKNKSTLIALEQNLLIIIYYAVIPKYHLLIRLKYMFILIADIQSSRLDFSRYDPRSNIFFLLDKYLLKKNKTQEIDETILYAIYKESHITKKKLSYEPCLNKKFLPDDIYEILYNPVHIKNWSSDLPKLIDWVSNLERHLRKTDYFAPDRSDLDMFYFLYNEFGNDRAFDFLLTCSEFMYVESRLFVERHLFTDGADYCHLYDKICDLYFHDIFSIQEINDTKFDIYLSLSTNKELKNYNINLDSRYLKDLNNCELIKNLYYLLVEKREMLYMSMALSGVSFCNFYNDYLTVVVKQLRKMMYYDNIYDEILNDWMMSDEYIRGMPDPYKDTSILKEEIDTQNSRIYFSIFDAKKIDRMNANSETSKIFSLLFNKFNDAIAEKIKSDKLNNNSEKKNDKRGKTNKN
ncbi:hypothetical protein TCON_0090 [Astathelohania contejeani]|uniref:Uncharacterized protein n=1 Tax=Astathelohania contejeani TaxID=164912 RepID=A0ABQ7I2M0_9MICR|nr:hypothetical protein TCON_0090 [Thelohania contejeani]